MRQVLEVKITSFFSKSSEEIKSFVAVHSRTREKPLTDLCVWKGSFRICCLLRIFEWSSFTDWTALSKSYNRLRYNSLQVPHSRIHSPCIIQGTCLILLHTNKFEKSAKGKALSITEAFFPVTFQIFKKQLTMANIKFV